jgi:hypothetical protein
VKVSISEQHITSIRVEEEIEMLKVLLSVCVHVLACKSACNGMANNLITFFLWGMEFFLNFQISELSIISDFAVSVYFILC